MRPLGSLQNDLVPGTVMSVLSQLDRIGTAHYVVHDFQMAARVAKLAPGGQRGIHVIPMTRAFHLGILGLVNLNWR